LQCDPCFDESEKSSMTKREKKINNLGYIIIQYNTGHESYSQAGESLEIAKAGRNGPS